MSLSRNYLVSFVAFVCFATSPAGSTPPNTSFGKLRDRLIGEGWDSTRIDAIFKDARLQFLPNLVPLNLIEREVPDIYQKFLTQAALRDGYRYLREHRPEIQNLLLGTGISAEVVVAILKIESDLGRKPGNHSTFSSLATITTLADSQQWLAQYDTSGGARLEAMARRAVRRSNWAYKELNQFLQTCDREGWDPLEVKGSWAGAFGWAQFLPSSYLRFGRDGDGDGKINPDTLTDAVASMAYFLKQAGWQSRPAAQRRALMQYNPSTAYVNCVLEYARKLKDMAGRSEVDAEDVGFTR
jgi:membrane-bound lytic murein transglycosylase B